MKALMIYIQAARLGIVFILGDNLCFVSRADQWGLESKDRFQIVALNYIRNNRDITVSTLAKFHFIDIMGNQYHVPELSI